MDMYVPKIRKEGGGSNRAKYIEYFEEKVVCEEREQVYSPMTRWDKSKFSKDCNFNSRLLQHHVAKNDLRAPGGRDSLNKIKKVPAGHMRRINLLVRKSLLEVANYRILKYASPFTKMVQ